MTLKSEKEFFRAVQQGRFDYRHKQLYFMFVIEKLININELHNSQ
jgi:hypothetical protein